MLEFLSIAPLCVVMLPVVLVTEGQVKIIALAIQAGLLLLQVICGIIGFIINKHGG